MAVATLGFSSTSTYLVVLSRFCLLRLVLSRQSHKYLSKSLTDRATYHAAMLEEARRETNSTTFVHGSREEDVPVVQPATAIRTGWSFVGFPGYQDHARGPWQQEATQARAQAEQTQFQNNLRDTVVAGVVAGIGEAQSHRTESNRSALTLTLSRLTAEITILLGLIPIKGGSIHTDSQEWDTYLKSYIMAAGKMSALPDDPHCQRKAAPGRTSDDLETS